MWNDELMHYGRSKKDGAPIGTGNWRRTARALTTPSIKNGKDKPNISPAEKVVRETQRGVEDTQNIVNSVERMKMRNQPADPEMSQWSDAELRERINRINLEQTYANLTKADTTKGFETAKDILEVVGSVVAITGGAVAIYSTLANLKKN